MNPLSSFYGPVQAYPHRLASGFLAPTSTYEINQLFAIQREQERLQLLKQMQILKLQNQLQTTQYLQNPYKIIGTNFAKINLQSPEPLTIVPRCATLTSSFQTIQLQQEESFSPQDSSRELKSQIRNMLQFFINKFEKLSQEEISQVRSQYFSHSTLLKLFDKLVQRYSASGKSREDMIRSILRGALRFLKDTYRTKFHLTSKAASIRLCQKYFKPEDMEDKQINFEDEDQVLSFLLPYKKNSRNKTPNTRFITEIFASEEFRQDYSQYLEKYDEAFQEENSKKVVRFCDFLLKCVEDDTLERVQNYKRLPWLKTWQEATKIVALELLDQKLQQSFNRKVQEKEIRKQRKLESSENEIQVSIIT